MKLEFSVRSPAEWAALPEMTFPLLKDDRAKGSLYAVHKVGFLAATKDQCVEASISAEVGPAGKCFLPTAVVEFVDELKLCRLPLSLAPWALDCVALAHARRLQFPARVEFGTIDDRPYAEVLL